MKPMLAATVKDVDKLRYPLIASPKLDGVRCLKVGGKLVTRTGKAIPNRYINKVLTPLIFDGFDGELMVGKTFQDVTSGVMSRDGEPRFVYHVFDYVLVNTTYQERADWLCWWGTRVARGLTGELIIHPPLVKVVKTRTIKNRDQLERYEAQCIAKGYEGIMLRDPNGLYKHGRSTFKEHGLMKLKRFEDSEAVIVGFEEEMQNTNKKAGERRTTHKAGLVPKNTMGKFAVRDPKLWGGAMFYIGTGQGLTKKLRQEIWDNQDLYVRKIIKYKYQKHGSKDLPRLPVFLGFRDKADL